MALKNKYIYLFTLPIILTFQLTSCEKQDDFSNIYANYQYNGAFSVPIGNTDATLKEFGIELPANWEEKPDSLKSPKTIKISDTLSFDFLSTIKDTSKVRQLALAVIASNDFPAEVKLKISFTNSSLSKVDDIPDSIKIENAIINNNNGTVIKRGTTLQYIVIPRSNFKNWSTIRNLILNGYIKNEKIDTSLYKYYKNYHLKVDLGLQIDFDFNIGKL